MSTTKVELVAPNHPEADKNKYWTLEEAKAYLTEGARSSVNLKLFKALWDQSNPKFKKKGSAIEQRRKMIMGLAERLVDGSLRVRQRNAPGAGGSSTARDEPTGFREPRPSWNLGPQLKIRNRPEPAAVLPPEPPTDVKQQIDVLKRAAKSGAPFCERCHESN